jgi:outer membrane protein assembly factor BamB
MAKRNRLATLVLAGLTALGSAAAFTASAADWPNFRGPNHDNLSKETGLLQEWPAGGPPLAWKVNHVGEGHSSVAIANGKIFTSGLIDGVLHVLALNEADGKRLWKSPAGAGATNNDGQGGRGSRGTPTIDGDFVYHISPQSDVYCYTAADGKEVWKTNLNKEYGGKMMSGWGNSESLLVDGDLVVCTPGGAKGSLLALDKKTGKAVWQTKDYTDPAGYASPFVAEIGGVRQVIAFTAKTVAGIDLKDGNVLWRSDFPGQTAVIPTPVVKGNHVYVTSGYGVGSALYKISSESGKFSAEKVYGPNKNMVNHHGGVILLGDYVYGYSDGGGGRGGRRGGGQAPPPQPAGPVAPNGWTCQELLTGNTKWSSKAAGKGTIAYADNRFYLREESPKGTLVLIEATPEGWNEKGRFDQPERSKSQAWPHLVVANGKLYVRDHGLLLCYDIKAK